MTANPNSGFSALVSLNAQRVGEICRPAALLGALAACWAAAAVAETPPTARLERRIAFDVPAQRADLGINELARQADAPVLFPYDDVQSLRTREVQGEYRLAEAIELLLADTGLAGSVSETGVVTIAVADDGADGERTMREGKSTTRGVALGAAAVAGLAAGAAAAQAQTEDAAGESGGIIEEIVTIGTRTAGRTAIDSPVPVDVLNESALEQTGAVEVGRAIQTLAPSFNFSSSTISDGTDALRPATLRGLGPDQTLVLVNGKRRHGSALIHVNTSVGRGTAGTDMNAIPLSAIKRIEVLRDGAAAQYGSDAIAGVINIVLKDAASGAELDGSYGEHAEGDGETFVASYNQGLTIADDGYLNFDVEYRDRGRTNRAGLTGVCQYVGTCTALPDGTDQTTDPREIGFDRLNFRIGDAESEHLAATVNLGVPLDGGNEVYAFATWSNRDNTSGGFYRRANQPDRNPIFLADGVTPVNNGDAFFPDGFLPLIDTEIDDLAINGGIMGEFGNGWGWDLSAGYGMNDFAFDISNSVNASLVSATGDSPTSAFAGELSLGLATVDFDMVKDQSWGVLAWGAAYRRDSYEISPGDEVSYRDFDTIDGVSIGPLDAAAGIQVFPGFQPENAVDEDRDAVSLYIDAEWDATDRLLLGGALRVEEYSDFGSTVNGKITAAFDASDTVRLRGALSTGFRAPSLQQQFFNNTSTQFVAVGNQTVAQQRGTFRNDSAVAKAIGIPELEEETSVNASVGVILQPTDQWTISLDYYRIEIEDRIVISGSIGTGLDPALDAALASANATAAQFFLNAADTTTSGVDLIASWRTEGLGGDWRLSFAGNVTETDIDSVRAPDALSTVPGIRDLVFTSQDRSILEEWQPESRVNFTANYERGPVGANLALNHYGEYTVEEGNGDRQTYDAKLLVDLQLRYSFTETVTARIGGTNIFDETPERNRIGQSRSGTIVDGAGNLVVDSPGVFTFSRRSAPFGFNGAYYYAGVDLTF